MSAAASSSSTTPSPPVKASSSTGGHRMPTAPKGHTRSNRSQTNRLTQSLRTSHASQQTWPSSHSQKLLKEMQKQLLAPLRPPDPTAFVQAGTSGVRHCFPIHLAENGSQDEDIFSRSISHLRSRTPASESCTNVDMIRNICASIKTLQHFDISENDLTELPLDICLLTNLETLNCSHNQLQEVPELFEQLKEMNELDLSFNLLKRLPHVVYKLRALSRLNCEHNSIAHIDPALLNLQRLKFFVFDHNQLDSVDTIDFGQVKKLEYIHIAHNQLVKFPRGLHLLHHLTNVDLSHNRLKTVPVDLLLVHTLDVLNLSHNSITKLPPMPVASKRASILFSIDFSFNQLTKFYDYLLLIALKIDVSNNRIRMLSSDLPQKLTNDIMTTRELKIWNNPLMQPAVPAEMLDENSASTINVLRMIRTCFDEQQVDTHVRQGFKLCVIGCKNSGKTSLVNCLEEMTPLATDSNDGEKRDRIAQVHQYPFRLATNNESSRPSSSSMKKMGASNSKFSELPKIQAQRPDLEIRKRRSHATHGSKQPVATANVPPAPLAPIPLALSNSPVPAEALKVVPLTIYDFNGSSEYYEHMSPFLDTNALHLLCVHTADFQQTAPDPIEQVFEGNVDLSSSVILSQVVQLLQLLCDKATKARGLVIIPVATCIDLYDKRPKQDKIDALEKINRFFATYLRSRAEQIKQEMELIHSLPLISSSLSERLKTYTSQLNMQIHIEPCQPVSSFTFQHVEELNRTIERCILIQKTIFPHVDRLLPTLWAEANQYIETLADELPVPYLSWNAFTDRVTSKHGLSHLINDMATSLHDEGKLLVFQEVTTTDRVVFLRPSWLIDLVYHLFRSDMSTTYLDYETNELFPMNHLSESRFRSLKTEFLDHGLLHTDLLHALWSDLVPRKEYVYPLWLTLMRFLLIAYPRMSKDRLKYLLETDAGSKAEKNDASSTDGQDESRFEYAIVPYYLPTIDSLEQQHEMKRFRHLAKSVIATRYTSVSFPLGFFHRFAVSAILRLNVVYTNHWNNFIVGEHEEKDVRFLIETDHRTYIVFHVGTSLVQQPFEELWNVLMPVLNHLEEMMLSLAPNHRFDRSVQCHHCHEFSFMGEWTTPKELQCMKTKACPSCGENIDTARLVQPNENKRRSEELLKRIRERQAKNAPKEADDVSNGDSHLLVPPV